MKVSEVRAAEPRGFLGSALDLRVGASGAASHWVPRLGAVRAPMIDVRWSWIAVDAWIDAVSLPRLLGTTSRT
eukprot:6153385-Pyramimonas_sp.AAC.1